MAETKTIWVRPLEGEKFRHHQTRVLHDGPFEADPNDLDIVRSLNWKALEVCDAPPEPPAAKAPKA